MFSPSTRLAKPAYTYACCSAFAYCAGVCRLPTGGGPAASRRRSASSASQRARCDCSQCVFRSLSSPSELAVLPAMRDPEASRRSRGMDLARDGGAGVADPVDACRQRAARAVDHRGGGVAVVQELVLHRTRVGDGRVTGSRRDQSEQRDASDARAYACSRLSRLECSMSES